MHTLFMHKCQFHKNILKKDATLVEIIGLTSRVEERSAEKVRLFTSLKFLSINSNISPSQVSITPIQVSVSISQVSASPIQANFSPTQVSISPF
jgi:hypothetical protein